MPKENKIPEKYLCSITGQVMIDPVMAGDGYTYEREAIEQWLQTHDTSPRTNEKLDHKKLTANHDKRSDILEFLDSHPELYEGDEIYLPKAWVAECVTAIKQNQLQAVQRWLDKDKRLLTLKLEDDATALHLACEFSSPELVDILLKNLKQRNQSVLPGAVGFKSIHLNILLERALISGDYAQCDLLLGLGAEVEQPVISNSQNALLNQMVVSENPEALSWLLDKTEIPSQNTLLHRMVINDNPEAVSWLLEKKAVLESLNTEGNTPLLLSVIHNHTKLTEFLLKKNANPQVKNAEQQSPVLIALLKQNESVLRLLVGDEKAAIPSLHLALELNDNEIIKALLNQRVGAIEVLDEQQRTPFYNAVERGNCEAAVLFLTQGANPAVSCGAAQLSTLHIATERGNIDMLRYLLQTRAVSLIDMQNAKGDTPLHLAVQAGHDSIIPLLLEAGAYHKIKNEQDQTPIELARIQQKPKLANLIVQTVRGLKQAKLKETDRLHQVVAEQASEIANLKNALRSQGQDFTVQLSDGQKEQARRIEQLESVLHRESTQTVGLKNALEIQGEGFKTQLSNVQQTMSPILRQFQVEEARRLEEKQLEEKRIAEKEKILKLVPKPLILEFLRLVAEGEQDEAEAMLKGNPNLALVPGDVIDLSKRTFNNITGFQYAVWALDWHMWTMIRKHLPDEAAREQAQGFETGTWVTQHGVHANLNTLIQAYRITENLYKARKYAEGDKAWIQQVGGAQLLLPAHVINEYCHPTRPFYPLPNFKDYSARARLRAPRNARDLADCYNCKRVLNSMEGRSTILRGERGAIAYTISAKEQGEHQSSQGLFRVHFVDISSDAVLDALAVRALTRTRTDQREELTNELKPKLVQKKVA